MYINYFIKNEKLSGIKTLEELVTQNLEDQEKITANILID